MNYRKINNLSGVVVLLIALVVYMMTLEPSTSLWDCGEYISTSNKLEVGHPPGAPTFALLGRLISAFSSPENAAYMVNSLSAISSALTIMFLFWTITYLARKFILRDEKELTKSAIIAIIGAGIIGSLAYMFSDTFWFSSEEGEVYAMSSFFTALTFWVILKWEENSHESSSDRWIVLIFFLIGFAIGVHLLNLLVIPAAAFVIYFKKYEFTYKGFAITGGIALGVLVFMNFVFIPMILSIADKFERFFNGMGFGFNTGAFIFFIVLATILGGVLFYAHKSKNRIIHVITLSFTVLIIGFSTFSVVVVRSNSNPPLDENNAETIPMLMSYLGREQYGETPLFKGPFWNSPQKQNTPVVKKNKYFKAYTIKYKNKEYSFQTLFEANAFKKKKKSEAEIVPKYIVSGYYFEDVYPGTSDQYTVFPRMYSPLNDKIGGYMYWSGYEGKFGVKAQNPKIPKGNNLFKDALLPTKSENFKYMTDYQFGWMYFRYFLWNFVGRQNDLQGHNKYHQDGMMYKGALTRGNWLSGVNFIDKERVGTQNNLPQTMTMFEAYNTYYYLPLILGLLGLVFMIVKAPKDAFSVFLLFLFTGLAIVFYLNQKPYEPRERDYAYAASFYAFAIWIGFGVLAIYKWAQLADVKEMKNGVLGSVGAGVLFYIVELLNGSNHAFSYSILFMAIVGILMIVIPMFINKTLKNKNYLAIMAVAIGLVIPVIMGVQNWDDHDRSDRYFAREIAKNYLNSCDQNAILFCFGDNDTFPLWYAQEVEGIRTDMKVMNYSLLSSDWHYLQLKRKTYEADAIPTILDEPDFRAGTRDVVFINPKPNSKSISVRQLMLFMKKGKDLNDNDSKYGHSRILFNKVYLDVDKEACLKNGLVREDQKNSMVSRIEWTLGGRYLSKADLALIDILAAYKWDRPLYFTSNSIQGSNSGLSEYLQAEGMTYKFVPIKSPTPYKEKMYSLLMGEKVDFNGDSIPDGFNWGNIEKEEVFADYYTMRMIRGARSGYLQLAERFQVDARNLQNRINAGLDSSDVSREKVIEYNKKSIKLLDKMYASFPIKSCKIDQMMNYSINLYKRAGDTTKSKELAEELAVYYNENVEYFSQQNEEYILIMFKEISDYMKYFDALVELTEDNKYKLKDYNPDAFNRLAFKIGNLAKSNTSFAKSLKNDIVKMYKTQRAGLFSPEFYSVATPFLMPRRK